MECGPRSSPIDKGGILQRDPAGGQGKKRGYLREGYLNQWGVSSDGLEEEVPVGGVGHHGPPEVLQRNKYHLLARHGQADGAAAVGLEGLAGLIVGSFEDCGSENELYDLFKAFFKEQPIPILGGFEAGHGKNNRTIPFGTGAELDADRHRLIFFKQRLN